MVLPRTPISAGRIASATFRGLSASLDTAHVHAPRQHLHTVPACNPPAILAAQNVARLGSDGRAGRRGFSSLGGSIFGNETRKPKPKEGAAAGGGDRGQEQQRPPRNPDSKRPPRKPDARDPVKIFNERWDLRIEGLPADVDSKSLKLHFEEIAQVVNVHVAELDGKGFITYIGFENEKQARAAVSKFNRTEFMGHKMLIRHRNVHMLTNGAQLYVRNFPDDCSGERLDSVIREAIPNLDFVLRPIKAATSDKPAIRADHAFAWFENMEMATAALPLIQALWVDDMQLQARFTRNTTRAINSDTISRTLRVHATPRDYSINKLKQMFESFGGVEAVYRNKTQDLQITDGRFFNNSWTIIVMQPDADMDKMISLLHGLSVKDGMRLRCYRANADPEFDAKFGLNTEASENVEHKTRFPSSPAHRDQLIYVANYPPCTTDDDIKAFVGEQCETLMVRRMIHTGSKAAKEPVGNPEKEGPTSLEEVYGHAYVTLTDKSAVQRTIEALHGKDLGGRKVVVNNTGPTDETERSDTQGSAGGRRPQNWEDKPRDASGKAKPWTEQPRNDGWKSDVKAVQPHQKLVQQKLVQQKLKEFAVFVGKVPEDWDAAKLSAVVAAQCPEVTPLGFEVAAAYPVRLEDGSIFSASRGFGFVFVNSSEDLQAVIGALNGHKINDEVGLVARDRDNANPDPPQPKTAESFDAKEEREKMLEKEREPSDPAARLYIGGIPNVPRSAITQFLSAAGHATKVFRPESNGRPATYALVTMANKEQAARAVVLCDGKMLNGVTVNVHVRKQGFPDAIDNKDTSGHDEEPLSLTNDTPTTATAADVDALSGDVGALSGDVGALSGGAAEPSDATAAAGDPTPQTPTEAVTPPASNAPLPPGWSSRPDPTTGKVYYYNTALKITQWEHPAPVPEAPPPPPPPPPPPAPPAATPVTTEAAPEPAVTTEAAPEPEPAAAPVAKVVEKLVNPKKSARQTKQVRASDTISVQISEKITIKALSDAMGVRLVDIIKVLIKLGDEPKTVSHEISLETAELLVLEYNMTPVLPEGSESMQLGRSYSSDEYALLPFRPPIVTVMGHVDHGKTSLLDYLRQTSVAAGEAGGITQGISAFEVTRPGLGKMCFIDTPGHKAFSAMRQRGAKATDIVILVVDACDGLMPQSLEVIQHARAAQVPLIIAVNKCDLPEAQPDRVLYQLAEHGVMVESMGGDVMHVNISARTGMNIDELEKAVLLLSEMMELRAPDSGPAEGVVVEARKDKALGPVASVVITSGKLAVGDYLVAGIHWGKVKVIRTVGGTDLTTAGPSSVIEVVGFRGQPGAGDELNVAPNERVASTIAERRALRAAAAAMAQGAGGDGSTDRRSLGGPKPAPVVGEEGVEPPKVYELPIVIKADVDGALEAVVSSIMALPQHEVTIKVVSAGIGPVADSDLDSAVAAGAVIYAFNLKNPSGAVLKQAREQKIEIVPHDIIYNLINEVTKAAVSLLPNVLTTITISEANVQQIFELTVKRGVATKVAGCRVTLGTFVAGSEAQVVRAGDVIHTGKVESLRHNKDTVKEISIGVECGITLEDFTEFKGGDIIRSIRVDSKPRTSL